MVSPMLKYPIQNLMNMGHKYGLQLINPESISLAKLQFFFKFKYKQETVDTDLKNVPENFHSLFFKFISKFQPGRLSQILYFRA